MNHDFIAAAKSLNAVVPPERVTRILRLPEVITRVGLRRASIYQQMSQGAFPQSISLGIRAVGWLESEIDAWVANRIQARGQSPVQEAKSLSRPA